MHFPTSPLSLLLTVSLALVLGWVSVRLADGTTRSKGPLTPARRWLAQAGMSLIVALLLLRLGINAPLPLFAVLVALVALGAATITDIREHEVEGLLLLSAALLISSAGILAALFSAKDWTRPLWGMAVMLAISGLLWLGGWCFARLRGAPLDPETGKQVEDFGLGDVVAWLPVGALLGPLGALAALVASVLINGFVLALPVMLFDHLRRRPPLSHHLPLLPGISLAVLLVLLLLPGAAGIGLA